MSLCRKHKQKHTLEMCRSELMRVRTIITNKEHETESNSNPLHTLMCLLFICSRFGTMCVRVCGTHIAAFVKCYQNFVLDTVFGWTAIRENAEKRILVKFDMKSMCAITELPCHSAWYDGIVEFTIGTIVLTYLLTVIFALRTEQLTRCYLSIAYLCLCVLDVRSKHV